MKRNVFRMIIMTLVLSGAMSSCIMYHPHTTSLPLLHEKGEMQVEASFSTSAPLLLAPALNASFAYAPTTFLGTQAAVSFTDLNSLYVQLQTGAYKCFDRAVVEWYLGYGNGSSYGGKNKTVNNQTYYVDGFYQLPFTQINFGWRDLAKGALDIGFGIKGGVLLPEWDKIEVMSDGTETIAESHNDGHALIEPQMMLRFGFQKVKFTINLAYSYLSDWPKENSYFNYERLGVGLGVSWGF